MNFHYEIFIQALLARLLPIYDEVTLSAWMGFGHALSLSMIITAMLGALAGYIILYSAGRMLAHSQWIASHISGKEEKARRLIIPLLCIAPLTPFILPIVLGAGLYRVKMRHAVCAVLFAEMLYRTVMVLA